MAESNESKQISHIKRKDPKTNGTQYNVAVGWNKV